MIIENMIILEIRSVYVFIQTFCDEHDETQSQFLNGVKLVSIQIFPSLQLVAITRLRYPSLLYFLLNYLSVIPQAICCRAVIQIQAET